MRSGRTSAPIGTRSATGGIVGIEVKASAAAAIAAAPAASWFVETMILVCQLQLPPE